MKNKIRAAVVLAAALCAAPVFAQDAAAPETAPADAPAHHHHHHHHHHKGGKDGMGHGSRAGYNYDECVKQKTAVAENFCNSHGDSCQAEKDGIAKQCHLEARGVRQTG